MIQANDLFSCILFAFGGLGIFLYGINLMGDSLKDLAGDKLKIIIEKSTNTPLKGILVGAGLTAIIQSSSGTTALTVALVSAGLMTLRQAVGIIMGANIGTTITAFIVGLSIERYSLIFIGIGAILIFFVNVRKIKELGKVILGFGLLFFGLDCIGGGLDYLIVTYQAEVEQLFETFANIPILGVLLGAGVTAVIQSSSACIAILQKMYETGALPLMGALAILIGSNIGTTITAVIASLGGSTEGKRTAVVHTVFNLLGAILFMILLTWAYAPLMSLIETHILIPITGQNPPSMTIAIAHLIFNVVTTIVLYFFINQLVKFSYFVIRDKGDSKVQEEKKLLDDLVDYALVKESPQIALAFVDSCMNHMGGLVKEYFTLTKSYVFEKKKGAEKRAQEIEDTIDTFDKRIHDYLIRLTSEHLHKSDSRILSRYLDSIKDFERIGDHCSNIMEFFEDRYKRDLTLSLDSLQDLEQMFSTVEIMVENATKALADKDHEAASKVEETERLVDGYQQIFHDRHMHRLNKGVCTYENSDYYMEILSNLERIGDHCKNVADSVLLLNRASVNNVENK